MEAPPPTADLAQRVADAVRAVRARTDLTPRVGLTLGSGLGKAIDALEDATTFQTADLPHWPRSTVEGHAVGGVNPEYGPDDLMVATDHINFIGKRGLFSPDELRERRMGRRLVTYYSPGLRARLIEAGMRAGVRLQEGTLMGGTGPSYETASEVQFARAIGADAVCMSTVHEVTVAAELGCEVASISCVTNKATGLSKHRLEHDEVTVVGHRCAEPLRRVLTEFLKAESQL